MMFRISRSVDFMPTRPMRPMLKMVSSTFSFTSPSPGWKAELCTPIFIPRSAVWSAVEIFAAQEAHHGVILQQLLDKYGKNVDTAGKKVYVCGCCGYEYVGDTRTVDVHVKRLREKIKDHASWQLSTVWGIGYKFEVKN